MTAGDRNRGISGLLRSMVVDTVGLTNEVPTAPESSFHFARVAGCSNDHLDPGRTPLARPEQGQAKIGQRAMHGTTPSAWAGHDHVC